MNVFTEKFAIANIHIRHFGNNVLLRYFRTLLNSGANGNVQHVSQSLSITYSLCDHIR